jgi:hypothetical protein
MAFSEPTEDIVEAGDNLLPFTANEDVLRGQVVKIAGGDIAVQPSDTDGEVTHGVCVQTVSSGDQVTVAMSGVEVEMTAGTNSISRGDPLTSHGGTGEEGQVDTASATGDSIIGYALEGSSAQGDLVRAVIDLGGEVN